MIPFSPPRIDEDIIKEVVSSLQSGWITTGPKTKLFEKEISKYCSSQVTLAVNSWTAGAEMLLRWFGIKEGDEVIIPAYTYCATANIVIHCGAKPVMVDIGDDFCLNLELVEEAITSKTKAIIPVDLGGYPVEYNKLNEIINKKQIVRLFEPNSKQQHTLGRILILSDAAHSFGAKYFGKKMGTNADFTVFSFHAVKNLTTAEGGAISINLPSQFNNNEVYRDLNILSLHGQNKDALAKTQKGAWEYDVLEAGFKCNMTDILASIGLVELNRYNSETLPKRKSIFETYTSYFKRKDWAILPEYKTSNRESSYHLYLLRIKDISLEQRNKIIQEIFNLEVAVNVHYKPLPALTFYKKMGYDLNEFPISKLIWECEISLPVYYNLGLENAVKVCEAVNKAYNIVMENG